MRLLKADEIECRVGQQTKDKSKYSVLLYKTARTDMALLDEEYGPMNWKVDYQTVGNSLFCTISVWDAEKKEWISKQSNGSESNIEAEKGAASDSLKRAGFLWNIGRSLYSAPKIWLSSDINSFDLEVTDIGYNEKNEINRLVISAKGTVVYEMGKYIKPEKKQEPKVEKKEEPTANQDDIERLTNYKSLCELADKTKVNALLQEIGINSWKGVNSFVYNQIKQRLANG